jgi:hypothetical protein
VCTVWWRIFKIHNFEDVNPIFNLKSPFYRLFVPITIFIFKKRFYFFYFQNCQGLCSTLKLTCIRGPSEKYVFGTYLLLELGAVWATSRPVFRRKILPPFSGYTTTWEKRNFIGSLPVKFFLARAFFSPENGGDTFLRNVGSNKIHTAPHSRGYFP